MSKVNSALSFQFLFADCGTGHRSVNPQSKCPQLWKDRIHILAVITFKNKHLHLVWPGDVPDLCVSVLTSGHEGGVVQPVHSGYLTLKTTTLLIYRQTDEIMDGWTTHFQSFCNKTIIYWESYWQNNTVIHKPPFLILFTNLVMRVPHDTVLVGKVHGPDDDGTVEATASHVDRVRGPRHTVHLETKGHSEKVQ